MGKKVKYTGSRLLGAELRRLRGERSLGDIAALSRSTPLADRQAALAEVVQRRDLLGRGARRAQRQEIHRGAEREPGGDHRRLRELQQRVVDRPGVSDVVPDPQRVDA